MQGVLGGDDVTACEFRTAQDVTLWPIEVAAAELLLVRAGPAAERRCRSRQRIKGGVRIRLRTTGGVKFSHARLDRLRFYLAGRNDVANKLLRARHRHHHRGDAWCRRPRARPPAWHEPFAGCDRAAGRLRRCGRAAAGDAALVPGLPTAAGVFLVPAAVPFLRRVGSRAGRSAAATAPSSSWCCSSAAATRRSRASSTRRTSRCSARRRSTCSPSAPIASTSTTARTSITSCRIAPAARFRGLRGDRRDRPRRRQRQRAGVPTRSTRPTAPTTRQQQSAYFTTRREPRLVTGGAAAPRRALELHRQRGVPVAGRRAAGAVQRRPAAAVGADAVHQSRPGAADADRDRPDRFHAGHRRTGASDPGGQRTEPSVRAAGRWRRRLARHQPSVAQLPVAGRHRRRSRARRRCASCSSCMPRAAMRRRGGRSRASERPVHPVVRRLPPSSAARVRGATAAGSTLAFGRGLEVDASTSTSWRSKGGSAFLLGSVLRAVLRALRVDQFVHRNGAALAWPRRDQSMGATVGRETDAVAFFHALASRRRTATTSTRRCAGSSVCTRTSRAWGGRGVPPTSRCASARIPSCRSRRRRWPRSSWGEAGRRPRLQVRLFGLLGPNGPLPLHITEYARERLRHANDPTLSRFLDLFHHRFLTLFYRAWAQAQPHVNRDRPRDDRFAVYVGSLDRRLARRTSGSATRCPTWPSSFTSARSSGTRATPRACALILAALLPGAGGARGVRRPLAAAWRTRAHPRVARRGARPRRGARRPGLGSAAQVPHPARAADAGAVRSRSCPAGRCCGSWSTGCGCTSTSSSSGTCGSCSTAGEVPALVLGRGGAPWLDDLAGTPPGRHGCRRPVPERGSVRQRRSREVTSV